MRNFGMLQLPGVTTIKEHMGKVNGEAGHSNVLYSGIREAAKSVSEQDRRSCALIFDEINVVGDLAFKIVNGEYHFFGLVSEELRAQLFTGPPSGTIEEQLKAKQATHALVFQVTTIAAGSFKRVCGIHPVTRLNAAMLDQLFWETVHRLQVSGITIVAAICDGAGCNRLFQKMQTSDLRKSSPDTFVSSWCFNKVADDMDAKIFFISDPSHFIKKCCNHWEKSKDLPGSRSLALPDLLVQQLLLLFEPSGTARVDGKTVGEECFARLFGRLYDLLASSYQPPYYHGEVPLGAGVRDPRIRELRDILLFVRMWHDFVEAYYATAGAKERSARFLSHQLYFDLQMMIDGFIELLTYLQGQEGVIAVIARKLSQDSLESLFGSLRFNCGSGRDPSIFKAVHALPRVEELRVQRRHTNFLKRLNSGNAGSTVRVGGGSDFIDGHRIIMPDDLKEQCEAAWGASVGASEPDKKICAKLRAEWMQVNCKFAPHPVLWQTLKEFQAKDEARAKKGWPRLLHWLRASQHINKTGFSRMKVGLAVAVISIKTAKQLRLNRRNELRWGVSGQ